MEYTFKVIGKYPKVKKGTIVTIELKVAQYDEFVKDFDGILERYFDKAPAVVFDGKVFMGDIQARQPDGFKDVLSKIAAAHPISPLADRYKTNKTVKEVQTREVVNKMKAKVKKEKKQVVYRNKAKW